MQPWRRRSQLSRQRQCITNQNAIYSGREAQRAPAASRQEEEEPSPGPASLVQHEATEMPRDQLVATFDTLDTLMQVGLGPPASTEAASENGEMGVPGLKPALA